ncbi:GOLPH3/VPS74 family protein [Kitasatospora sp. NPDC001660]
MDVPTALPEKLYLLAYHPERERLTATARLDLVLRAAALVELLRRGLIRDDGRHPAAVEGAAADGLDPLSAVLLEQIREGRRRSWQHWIGRRLGPAGRATRVVRDGLAEAGRIRVEEHRILGIFPGRRVTLREPGARKVLAAAVTSALSAPLSRVDPADAALVALVYAARLSTALTWRRSREYRVRIQKLAPAAGPVPRALRRAIAAARGADGATA